MEKRKSSELPTGRLHNPAFARQSWYCKVGNDTRLVDVLKPAFLMHYVDRVKRHDTIEVVSEDCLLDVELRVVTVGEGLVMTRPIRIVEDREARAHAYREDKTEDEPLLTVPPGYKVDHNSQLGYYVKISATGMTPYTKLATFNEAAQKAQDHYEKANGQSFVDPVKSKMNEKPKASDEPADPPKGADDGGDDSGGTKPATSKATSQTKAKATANA